MSIFGKLADRLLATVASTTEVDAACILLRRTTVQAGWCRGSVTGDRIPRYKYTYIYDNCADRVTYSCPAA
ncbi:hypothetical protein Q0Z83_006040 [Actinoplanes sichuanensis]|uniref:Uncharacterized protein n=1 Tax=Actinoplanes sichuanensis TaxID=512349 RepID=A0ABW4AFR4_9ACTN|nr:hypothetical protein [Actinoplanes sichuanensis]BEL02413.1 hypothetical protein Q0Z83_006040 [Actinoplanes sichuanensis]